MTRTRLMVVHTFVEIEHDQHAHKPCADHGRRDGQRDIPQHSVD
jgi:hypothetical protein